MSTILVTGATGTLGRPTVAALRAAGHDVRALSRRIGDGRVVADLETGAGLTDALRGAEVVVHLATTTKKDSGQTRRLLEASAAAGVRHIVYISIVGIDDIPFAYYVDKVECERLVRASGIPWTILRATQFHDFVATVFRATRRLPFHLSLPVSDQPIAVEEVAERLAELASAAPAGRVADIGGPEILTVDELATQWQRAHGTTKAVWRIGIPGKTMRAFKAGHHLAGLPGYGRETFAEYAERDARGTNEA
jgi:uncharacterized protein YbjT (DUF2867 family)